jgi:hypothetical protein
VLEMHSSRRRGVRRRRCVVSIAYDDHLVAGRLEIELRERFQTSCELQWPPARRNDDRERQRAAILASTR